MANDSAESQPPAPVRAISAGRFYYGWYIVGATFITSLASVGLLYTFGAFFTAFTRTFEASYVAISGLFAVTLFVKAIFGAVAGRIADRVGPRLVVTVAGVVLFASLLLASRATALWQLYAAYGIGFGLASGALYVTGVETVERWFTVRRAEATGLAVAGVAAGNFLLPPLAALLIASAGWRLTLGIFGLGAALLLLLSVSVLSPSPEARGIPMEGSGARASTLSAAGLTVSEAMRTRSFWLLYGTILIAAWGYYIPFAEIAPDAEHHGMRSVVAAIILGLIGAGSLVARLLAGISDHLSRRRAWAAACAGMSLMFCWWLISDGFWTFAIFAAGFGLCSGTFITLISPLAADYFGTRHIGAIAGILLTGLAPGALLGPTLAGFAFDIEHSYMLPIAAGLLANLLALACVLRLPAPENQLEPSPHPASR